MNGDLLRDFINNTRHQIITAGEDNDYHRGMIAFADLCLEQIRNKDGILEQAREDDTRKVKDATCNACKHYWAAPTIGRCPKCYSEDVKIDPVTRWADYRRV